MMLLTIIVVAGITLFLAIPDPDPDIGMDGQNASMEEPLQDDQKTESLKQGAESLDYELVVAIGELQAELADYQDQIATAETQIAANKVVALEDSNSGNGTEGHAARIQRLGKLYASLKTDNAVTILSALEEPLSMEILTKMNSRASSKLIDAIAAKDPAYAVRISEFMAGVNTTDSSQKPPKESMVAE